MGKYKAGLEDNPFVLTCSTVGCKNKPVRKVNGLPFCNFCVDKLQSAGMIRSIECLPVHTMEHKRGARHG